MPIREQRAAPRYPVRYEASLRDRCTDRRLPVRICDLSATGAAISCSDIIVDDADYDLEFVVPGQTGEAALRAHCRVARVMLASGGGAFFAGLVFDDDPARRMPALERLFSQLQLPSPVH